MGLATSNKKVGGFGVRCMADIVPIYELLSSSVDIKDPPGLPRAGRVGSRAEAVRVNYSSMSSPFLSNSAFRSASISASTFPLPTESEDA